MAALWRSAHDKVPCISTYRTPEAASHNDRQEWQPWAGKFVKCESKQDEGKGSSFQFQKLKQCAHFEWLDEYIERIQLEVASRELDLPLEAKKFGSGAPGSGNSIGATVGDAAGMTELKKLNKKMKKLIELKKQGNLMVEIFYVCVIALAFVYMMIISRS
ncbi:hypothetical protein D1007_19452 [Hordeum vulgare]|nr:hypothetical protein D1007_19452 [Hordeum vulgare]